jgi:hypothetical protein
MYVDFKGIMKKKFTIFRLAHWVWKRVEQSYCCEYELNLP